ncbi:MAG: sterol desaturase family protein [Erythrobacter sp.]|jgi:sterol desaturase/sphingolipid hydroxylase (fatty acid hydroxylase superfamily)|uniref:sterol desaturase family protein n=1 Tax=Erythrobacter sp. TaxID=1042 RepID=UPI002B481E82|nr:sterol desaturase family protein [Erythrobacter sp.]WRH71298.1 MAG: sterol desaturase family protein [Erythrobacter sp.]
MFETFFETVRSTIFELVPTAAFFIVLAIIIKRDKVLLGLKAARREIGTNLGLLLFNTLVAIPLVALPVAMVRDTIYHFAVLAAFWESLPKGATLVAAIVIIDFTAYWRHRLEHSPELWRIHATHHADEAMNWLTLHRKHPFGEVLSLFVDLALVILLGLPAWAIVGAVMIRSSWGYLIHADVPWTLGPLGKVLISPAAHRLHHIRDEQLMGANFGNTITLWDKLFGTYVDPAPYVDCETGIAEGTRDVAGELWRPFEARYRRRSNPDLAAEPAE